MITLEVWEALERINDKKQLIFLTNRFGQRGYDLEGLTCNWLKKQGIHKPVVYFTDKLKGELADDLGVRLFMDDRQENCEDVADKSQAIVLMPHRSYNRSCTHPRVKRIWNFNELFAHLSRKNEVALKKIIPSRKATKRYLRGETKDN